MPISVHGKFFARAGQKFFLKAMRIPEVGPTLDFGAKLALRSRLEELRSSYTTGLILSESQADAVLDLAGMTGLAAMVEVEIDPKALVDADSRRAMVSRIATAVNANRGRSALAGYILDCPISADLLREHGVERIRRRLGRIAREIQMRDSRALVTVRHCPDTAALAAPWQDFIYASMAGLAPAEMANYVTALHNTAGPRPVVVEFADASAGLDELVATAFGLGAAGVVAAPRRGENTGWLGIRMMTANEAMPFVALNGTCPPRPPAMPLVSVVICAYNAERTMRACLESLRALKYPNYEVVIVDDGSRDSTAEISMDFPEFRLIRQPNKGLSVARNVGMQAATGEIVAYTDSDCVVDPDWLTLMVRAMTSGGVDGCGGPNYAPHEEGHIEACVAASPGAPCHVLVADDRAEHLAGCNMAFTKSALVALGGFDPQFTSAGDDVDICWRMLQAGFRLGFCPAAFVWHFRRNTVKAYYGQQRGYGRAEAMLYVKYPERFNSLGQIKWNGTIPGLADTVPGGAQKRIGWMRGRRAFQTVGEPILGLINFLPQTLEWTLAWGVIAIGLFLVGWSIIPALAMLALGPVWALYYAWHAPIEKAHDSIGSRLIVAFLAYTGPIVRTITRFRLRMRAGNGITSDVPPRQRPSIRFRRRALHLSYWNETWTTRDALLDRLSRLFARTSRPAVVDSGWHDYDLEVRPDPWTRLQIKTADEEHEGGRLRNCVEVRVRMSNLTRAALMAGAIGAVGCAALGATAIAGVIAALTAAGGVCAARELIESGRFAYRAVEKCAQELDLAPLGKPTAAERPVRAAALPKIARPVAVHATSVELIAENQRAE